jgi:DMSO/TMAO reductase YedYZ molybdopterin-dependent catalytic subunit
MKSYKIFSIFLILILVFSFSLSGCSPDPEENVSEVEDEETPVQEDAEKTQADEDNAKEDTENSVETDDEDKSDDEENIEEVPEEESEGENPSYDDTNNQESEESEEEYESSDTEEDNQEEEINMLEIEGSVENPLSLSLDDLKAMEDLIYSGTFYSLNNFGTAEYTDFTGVKLWNLLKEKALISEEATTVKVVAVDGYSMEFTVDQIKRDDYIDETNQDLKLPVIIAWEENGEEYNPQDGPPYKLVIGQKEPGDVNKPQWVRDIDKIIVE